MDGRSTNVNNTNTKSGAVTADRQAQFLADYRQNRHKPRLAGIMTTIRAEVGKKAADSVPIRSPQDSAARWKMSDSVDLTSLCTARDFNRPMDSRGVRLPPQLAGYRPTSHRRLLGQDVLHNCPAPVAGRYAAEKSQTARTNGLMLAPRCRGEAENAPPAGCNEASPSSWRFTEDPSNFMPYSMTRSSQPRTLSTSEMRKRSLASSQGSFPVSFKNDHVTQAPVPPATVRAAPLNTVFRADLDEYASHYAFNGSPMINPVAATGHATARPSIPFTPGKVVLSPGRETIGQGDLPASAPTASPPDYFRNRALAEPVAARNPTAARDLTNPGSCDPPARTSIVSSMTLLDSNGPDYNHKSTANRASQQQSTRNNRFEVPPLKLSLVPGGYGPEEGRKGYFSSRLAGNPTEAKLGYQDRHICASVRAPPPARIALDNSAATDNAKPNGIYPESPSEKHTVLNASIGRFAIGAATERDPLGLGRGSGKDLKTVLGPTHVSTAGHVNKSSDGQEPVNSFTSRSSSFPLRRSLLLKDVRHLKSFATIAMIGQGGYAIVRVVKHKDTGMVCALKQIAKADFTNLTQLRMAFTEVDVLCARESYVSSLGRNMSDGGSLKNSLTKKVKEASSAAERAVLIRKVVQYRGAEYFPEFYGCWQTPEFIFFLMEYLPGGDLMKHLIDREVFPEEVAKFYTAQVAVAIGFLHDHLHYVHRDMKPDNVLFDRKGHAKLVDFGLSRQLPMCRDRRLPFTESFQSAVGTPDYMAPEVHRPGHPHDRTIDWWSLGIILYEMLFGGPPLSDLQHRPGVTSQIIRNWKSFLGPWPKHPPVSSAAKDLLHKLIAEKEDRYKTVEEVLSHPWYRDLHLESLRDREAMIVPELAHEADVRNFDSFSMSKLSEWEEAKKKSTPSREVLNAFKAIALGPKSSTTHIPFATSSNQPQRPTTTSAGKTPCSISSSGNHMSKSYGTTDENQASGASASTRSSSKGEYMKRSVTQHSQLAKENSAHASGSGVRRSNALVSAAGGLLTSRETVPKQMKLTLRQLDRIPEGGALSMAKSIAAQKQKGLELGGFAVSNNIGKRSNWGRTVPRNTSPPAMNELSNSEIKENVHNLSSNPHRWLKQTDEMVSRGYPDTGNKIINGSARRVSQRMKLADKRTQTFDSGGLGGAAAAIATEGMITAPSSSSSSSSSLLSGLKNVVTRWLTSSTSSSHSSITNNNNGELNRPQPLYSHSATENGGLSSSLQENIPAENDIGQPKEGELKIDNTSGAAVAATAAVNLKAVTMSSCQTQPVRDFDGIAGREECEPADLGPGGRNNYVSPPVISPSRPQLYQCVAESDISVGAADGNRGDAVKQQLVRSHDGRSWQVLCVSGSQCCVVNQHKLGRSNVAASGAVARNSVACRLLNN